MPSSATVSVLESMPKRVLENIVGGVLEAFWEAYLGAYSDCTLEHLESLLGSVYSSRMEMCHEVQLGEYLRVFSGVCLRAYFGDYSQIDWECVTKCNWKCS